VSENFALDFSEHGRTDGANALSLPRLYRGDLAAHHGWRGQACITETVMERNVAVPWSVFCACDHHNPNKSTILAYSTV